jgi:hypothetical protein
MNLKGFGRMQSWPDQGAVPIFSGGTAEMHEKSAKIASVPVEIQMKHLPYTSVEH